MSTQTKFSKLNVLGVEIDTPTISQAIDHIVGLAPKLKTGMYIIKPYVEFFDREFQDPSWRQTLNQAYLCLPDGVALKWAAHFQKHTKRRLWDVVKTGAQIVLSPAKIQTEITDHFGGTNFTWPLLERCAQEGLSVYLVGSPQASTIIQTAAYIERKLPSLKICGTQTGRDPASGKYSRQMGQQLLAQLKELKPDIVLVGIDFATYVPLLARLGPQLPHSILIGEGGTFDYDVFGGRKKKAPASIQRMGIEWLWRLLIEPRRWKRQLAIPRFIWRVYRSSHSKQPS